MSSWYWSAVGYVESPQSQTPPAGDSAVVRGSGAGIWGEQDEFYYVHTVMRGDGSLAARVRDLAAVHEWSEAGVMLRESLDPGARNIFLPISIGRGSSLRARLLPDGSTVDTAGSDLSMMVGGSVRLTRVGNRVLGELSVDGTEWRELGEYELPMGPEVLIGLAVTARHAGGEATATFSEIQYVNLEGGPPTPGSPEAPRTPATGPADRNYALPPATLFVDADNGNDRNSGRSEGAAFRSVARAAQVVKPGDVVYIREGVYPIEVYFKASGTASKPIVWASYPGETAIFDGSDQPRGRSQHRIWVDGASFNHFVNFEVRNSPQQGILVQDANDNLFHGIVTHGNNGSGIQNYSGNRNRYQYILTYDNFDEVTTDGKTGENADGLGVSSGDGNVVRYVISYSNSDDGIDAWHSTNTVIEYSISFDNGRGTNGNGNGFKLGGDMENHTVARFNIAFGNRSVGFTQNSGRNLTVYNNTAFDNGGPNFVAGDGVLLRNNLSVDGTVEVGNGADHRNNSWNLRIRDPGLRSRERGSPDFLALQDDSSAIDAGVDVGLPFTGQAPDLGALEHPATIADLLQMDELDLVGDLP